jgi:phosphate transport system protein
MSRPIDHDLLRIRDRIVFMGGSVEAMIAGAVTALVEHDRGRAGTVVEADVAVDRLENEIDSLCHSVLVRHQPTAIDHRFLMGVMKITNDLERVGDSAKNIGRCVMDLTGEAPLQPYADLRSMSSLAQAMLGDALQCFVLEDLAAAYGILKRDDEVDRIYRRVLAQLQELMQGNPAAVGRGVQLILIARNLERIGDHATNIAESVIYYLQGLDVRHPAAAG